MAQDNEITLATILEHLRGMEHRLRTEFKSDLRREVGSLRMELKTDIARVDRKVDRIVGQMDMIDSRLDDIEVVQIPLLKKAVGIA